MTATGELVDGKPHIHAVMAVQGDRTIGGHLHQAQPGSSCARAYVMPTDHHVAISTTRTLCSQRYPIFLWAVDSDTRVVPE
jgi:predicted DNA-binding protein with PD1-like motif